MSAPIPEAPEPTLEVPDIPEFNLDAVLDDPTPVADTTTSVADTGTGVNPAWDTLKEKLPAEFHSQVDPILSEWDKGVQQKFQQNAEELRKYEAYKEFVEGNVDPNELRVSRQLVQNLNTDPLTFYNNLASMLRENGLLQEAAQVQAKADDLEGLEQVADPRIDALAKQQQEIVAALQAERQAQLQAQADARWDAQIKSDMEFIESKTGPLPEWAKTEVVNRAGLMTQQLNRPVSLVEAYKDFQKTRQQILNTPRPGEKAPRVVPGGGGFPQQKPNPDALKTYEGRSKAIADILARENGS